MTEERETTRTETQETTTDVDAHVKSGKSADATQETTEEVEAHVKSAGGKQHSG